MLDAQTTHSLLWTKTWQVVSLGMLSTFAFLWVLVLCLKIMGKCIKRDKTISPKERD